MKTCHGIANFGGVLGLIGMVNESELLIKVMTLE
jgi:hypothetical protein